MRLLVSSLLLIVVALGCSGGENSQSVPLATAAAEARATEGRSVENSPPVVQTSVAEQVAENRVLEARIPSVRSGG